MKLEFRLVLPVRLEDWLGGYAAGSIAAHYIHYKKHGKVFWYCSIYKKGFGFYKDYVDENWDEIRKNPSESSDRTSVISNVGYFYETGRKEISWQFKLEGIFKEEELTDYQKENYIPRFRKVYLGHTQYWMLLSEFKKLYHPIKFIGADSFGFLQPNSRTPNAPRATDIRNNSFVVRFPNLKDTDLYEPETDELLDIHLKELLRYGQKDKLREENIQRAFFYKLLSEGVIFAREGILPIEKQEKGRYDFLIRKGDKFLAFEFKLDDDPNAPEQLEEYINAISEENKILKDKIKGYIVCGNPSLETRKEADDRKYEVLTYKINLDFPWLKKILYG